MFQKIKLTQLQICFNNIDRCRTQQLQHPEGFMMVDQQMIKVCQRCSFPYNISNLSEERTIQYFLMFVQVQNTVEAEAIIELVDYLTRTHLDRHQKIYKDENELYLRKFIKKDISIIAAYKAQYYLIKELLKQRNLFNFVELDTIDAFQGKENFLVIISLVRSSELGFLKNRKRCNVSLSRAKYGQFIFGNEKLLLKEMNIWKWILEMFEKNQWIRDYTLDSADNRNYFKEVLMKVHQQSNNTQY